MILLMVAQFTSIFILYVFCFLCLAALWPCFESRLGHLVLHEASSIKATPRRTDHATGTRSLTHVDG